MIRNAWESGPLKDHLETVNNAMNMCFADEASSAFKSEGKTWKDCVTIEAQLNCHPRVWSSLMCVMAFSSLIGAPIVSIYPESGQTALEKLFNCRILPKIETPGRKEIVVIWSRSGNLDYTPNSPYQPNHFVPLFLLPKTTTEDLKKSTDSPKTKSNKKSSGANTIVTMKRKHDNSESNNDQPSSKRTPAAGREA